LFVYRTSVKNIRFISLIIAFSFYYNISFRKIIKEMSFATFDVALHYLLEKKTRVWRLTKQIITIEKKKRANKLKRRLYDLTLCDERTLIYVETIYATKLRNRTILNLSLRDDSQDLMTIKATTFAIRLKIALEVFQK